MGGEVKTSVSDDFKSLEIEMGLRQEGISISIFCSLSPMSSNSVQAWNDFKNL